jgi:hypothetical protein
VTRAIGWVFVAAIGYHALLAVADARRAGAAGHGLPALGYTAIGVVAGLLVIVACAHAVRGARGRVR